MNRQRFLFVRVNPLNYWGEKLEQLILLYICMSFSDIINI